VGMDLGLFHLIVIKYIKDNKKYLGAKGYEDFI